MENKDVLEKVSEKRAVVGEMEKAKINKSNWVALIVAGVLAVIFMIIEGLLKHFEAIYAIAGVCYAWASVFYFCQFFIAKRKYVGIMIGAILTAIAFCIMLTFYVLYSAGVL